MLVVLAGAAVFGLFTLWFGIAMFGSLPKWHSVRALYFTGALAAAFGVIVGALCGLAAWVRKSSTQSRMYRAMLILCPGGTLLAAVAAQYHVVTKVCGALLVLYVIAIWPAIGRWLNK